jgi:cytochrome c553
MKARNGMAGEHWGRTACIAASVGLVVAGSLAPARSAPQAPDLELGRYLAAECMTCHRRGGPPAAAGQVIPNIFGMAAATFVQVIKAYRSKELPNTVMQTVTARLKDDEIEALAAFFAGTKH